MSCPKESILMLGGSRQQVVAIEKAKQLGFRTALCAMGEDPGDLDWDSAACDRAYATYVLHSGEDGVFEGVEKSGAMEPHMYREVVCKQMGEPVETFDGANKALGIEFLRFDDEAEMDAVLHGISNEIRPVVVVRAEEVTPIPGDRAMNLEIKQAGVLGTSARNPLGGSLLSGACDGRLPFDKGSLRRECTCLRSAFDSGVVCDAE